MASTVHPNTKGITNRLKEFFRKEDNDRFSIENQMLAPEIRNKNGITALVIFIKSEAEKFKTSPFFICQLLVSKIMEQ